VKQFLKRAYNWFMRPIYNRITLETDTKLEQQTLVPRSQVELRVQAALKANLEMQEKLTKKLVDELVNVHLELQRLAALNVDMEPPPTVDVPAEKIAKILGQIDCEMKIIELAAEFQVPMRDILVWRSKYNRMGVTAITNIRKLEEENLRLKQFVGAFSAQTQTQGKVSMH
jgi:hypothetical protein